MLAELFAHFLELALGAGAGRERLRDVSFRGRLGGALRVLARLFELSLLLGHLRLDFGALHALAQFVHVGEHLALLFLEAFELAAQLLAPGFVVRRLQGGLEFLEPFVHVFLAAGEFLQAILDLHLGAALLALLLLLRLAFGFVTIFGLLEVEFVELVLALALARGCLALRLLVLAAGDLGFAFAQFEEHLVGGLFGQEGIGQRVGRIRGLVEPGARLFHLAGGRLPEDGARRFLDGGRGFVGLVYGVLLRIADHFHILGVRFAGRLGALEFPGRVDDLFLQLGQACRRAPLLAALLLLLLLLLVRAFHPLALAKDFLERTDLGEIEIPLRAPSLAVRADVVRPHEPRKQFVFFRAARLQLQHVLESGRLLRWHVFAQLDQLRRLAAARNAEPERQHAKVIPRRAFERHFLQRGRPDVAARRSQFQLRRTVRQRLEHEQVRRLVGAPVRIRQLEFVRVAGDQREIGQRCHGARGIHGERHGRGAFFLRHQGRADDRFVELQRQGERGAFDGADAARVFDPPCRQAGVGGRCEFDVRALQPGMFVDGDGEIARAAAAVVDAVRKPLRHIGHGQAENRIGQAAHERQAPFGGRCRADHQVGGCRHGLVEPRHHGQAAAALQARVPGRHGHAIGRGFAAERRGKPLRHNRRTQADQPGHAGDRRHRGGHTAGVAVPGRGDRSPVVVDAVAHGVLEKPLLEKRVVALLVRLLLDRGEQAAVEIVVPRFEPAGEFPHVRLDRSRPDPAGRAGGEGGADEPGRERADGGRAVRVEPDEQPRNEGGGDPDEREISPECGAAPAFDDRPEAGVQK